VVSLSDLIATATFCVFGGLTPKEGEGKTTMRSMSFLPHRASACALLCFTALFCGSALTAQEVAPAIRIVDRIDESNLVTLKGNTHPAANAKNDRGRVSPSLRMTDLILVLSRSPQQQAAFDKFVASQYDSTSPNFHQWLTPEQVGQKYGPSQNDIAAVSAWLASHGLSVDDVPNDHMSIRFSGTAAQVESAFHTEIHNLEVKGVAHIGNMTDPQIPAAVATVVVGVKALHNFFPHPLHHLGGQVTRDSETGKWKRNASPSAATQLSSPASSGSPVRGTATAATARPEFFSNPTGYIVEDVGPYDFATIYNVLPLWNAGIDGTGQTIAIAGTSDIDPTDIATFRSFFGLPTNNTANTPIRVSGNSKPLTVCTDTTGKVPYPQNPCEQGDLIENSLDVEWSGSVAKNAQIVLVASYPASVSDDTLYDSENYIVNHSPLVAHIMNVSYGQCELANGTGGNVEYYNMWQSAASEGIAVFVAAGDSGSASCDDGDYFAESGLTVNGLASTPYNTAVGGTDFNWCTPDTFFNTECSASSYWSTTNNSNGASVNTSGPQAGYVRETPWNESCANPLTLKWAQDMANVIYGFPISDVSNPEQACNFVADFLYTGYIGGIAGLGTTYPYGESLLEAVGGGGGASGCVVGTPVTNSTTSALTGCSAGASTTGTSTNPDTGASQTAIGLYQNGWIKPSWQTGVTGIPSDGVRDLPDVSFFASDGYISSSAYLICVSAVAACSYDTQTEPIAQEVGGTSVATPAMAGVMALINQKTGASQGLPNTELYSLAAKQTYANCSAETVTPSSTCYFNDIDNYTNAMPCDHGAIVTSDVSPNCTTTSSTLGFSDVVGIATGNNAVTGYDLATGLGSLNVANVANGWAQKSSLSGGTLPVTVSVIPASTTITTSQTLGVTGTVASSPAGGGTPTGTVTLTAGSYSASVSLSNGGYSFTVPAGSVIGGTESINVAYSGDATFSSGSGQASVTVTGSGATFSLTQTAIAVNPATIAPGASATATVTVSSVAAWAGNVTLTCQLKSTTATGGDGATCTGGGEPGVNLTSSATTGTVVFTVSTTKATAAMAHPKLPGKGRGWEGAGSGAVLALLLFLGIPARRRSWRSMLGVLVVMAALGSLSACGGGSGTSTVPTSDPGTTAGTYTYTVQATSTPSVAPTVSTTFTVTVN
jgi:subtilase family serine protease